MNLEAILRACSDEKLEQHLNECDPVADPNRWGLILDEYQRRVKNGNQKALERSQRPPLLGMIYKGVRHVEP